MSTEFIDGAHEGVPAGDGMRLAISGGKAPAQGMTSADMEAYLLQEEPDAEGYSESAKRTARFILTTLRAHPELQTAPVESVWDWSKFDGGDMPPLLEPGLDTLLEQTDREGYKAAVGGITGFQWGWAVNAARHALGLRRVANPAIVEVDV